MKCNHKPRLSDLLVFLYRKKTICRKCGAQIALLHEATPWWVGLVTIAPAYMFSGLFSLNKYVNIVVGAILSYASMVIYFSLKKYITVDGEGSRSSEKNPAS